FIELDLLVQLRLIRVNYS
ncbi:unnamed protein product, partial [Rotaria sordida]